MKHSILTILATLAMAAACIAGCASAPGSPPQSPQQIAKQFCPSAQIALTSLQALDGISEANTDALTQIAGIVNPVCAAVAANTQVAPLDLKTFASQYSPVLVSIVKTSNLDPAKQNRILLDLAVAQIAIAALP